MNTSAQVEGAEGRLVPDLIGSGALFALDSLVVEWHDDNPFLKLPVEQRKYEL